MVECKECKFSAALGVALAICSKLKGEKECNEWQKKIERGEAKLEDLLKELENEKTKEIIDEIKKFIQE